MAYSFQVPRQRPKPLTEGAQLAEDQNTQGLKTGNFADVQSARGATDRSNALRTSNALQATRGTFARSGVDTSPEAAARAQDQSFSAAEGQNLNGTNAVNQLQRQYRNDAVTNANQYEAAANQRQQQGVSNDQFDKTFGANREDAATARNQFGLNYNAGREDANTAKTQFGETMAQRKNEFGVSSGQSQQQIDNQAEQAAKKLGYDYNALSQNDKQFFQKMAQEDSQFQTKTNFDYNSLNQTLGENARQFDAKLGQEGSQFQSKLRQDENQFGITSGMTQQQIDNQRNQFDKNYNQEGSQFDQTLAQNKSQFDLTRGDKQKSMTMDEINTIQDPVARNLALKAYYSGGDVGAAIGGNILSSGELDKKSMSPGTAAYQAKVDELQAIYPNKSKAGIEQMVRDRAAKADALTQGVSDTQTKAVSQQTSMERLSRLKAGETPAPEDLANIPSVNPAAIPLGKSTAAFLKNNTTGGWTNIGGQPYKVIKGDRWTTQSSSKYLGMGESARHEDFAELQDQSGKTFYLNAKGQIVDKKPGTK